MAIYQYRALQMDGSITEGVINAGGRQDALRELEKRRLNPIQISEAPGKTQTPSKTLTLPWMSSKVSFSALENFTRLLSSLLAAGVPLSRSLAILEKEASSTAAQKKWKEVRDLVIDGTSLADAMAQSPETFPQVYVAMVEAGETGGFLDVVLKQIADFQMREKDLRSKVFSALIYPALLMILAISVLIFLLVFFIPRFQLIFAGFGASLPTLTRIIVTGSEYVRSYGAFIALGIAIALYLAQRYFETDQGRRTRERFILQTPVLGPLIARFAMARFCRMLGTLLGAGVPLINALNVARKSIANQILVDTVSQSIERVKQGDRLAESLADCKQLFPGSVLEMISVAEEAGRMDEELVRLATVTEGDLDRQLKTAVALVEPIMLFLLAGFIGIIFVGMVIPIFTIQDYIK